MRIGSLFSGVGGLELGLERAGVGEVAWQVEREPYAQEVLAKHWPHAKRYDDVTTVGAHNLAPVDVICGGFPCQDISAAGRGAGLKGARSGLWFQMLRIIEEVKPYVVIAENVAALRARGLPVVVAGLRDAGYRVVVVPCAAEDVGAPHRRERIFICAIRMADASGVGRGGREAIAGRDDADRHEAGRNEGAGRTGAVGDLDEQGRAVGLADRSRTGREASSGDGVRTSARPIARSAACRGEQAIVGVGLANADGTQREGQRERAVADAGRRSELNRVAGDGHFGVGLADAKRNGRQGSRAHGHASSGAASGQGEASDALDGGAERQGVGGTKPAVGRATDGLSGGLDGVARFAAEVSRRSRWPSRPNEPQYDWEAPRTAIGVAKRANRLKALGNAVSPPVAEAVGRWVMHWIEHEEQRALEAE